MELPVYSRQGQCLYTELETPISVMNSSRSVSQSPDLIHVTLPAVPTLAIPSSLPLREEIDNIHVEYQDFDDLIRHEVRSRAICDLETLETFETVPSLRLVVRSPKLRSVSLQ